jgi:hypothetical protein
MNLALFALDPTLLRFDPGMAWTPVVASRSFAPRVKTLQRKRFNDGAS